VRSARITIAVALALTLAGIGLTLSRAPLVVAGSNSVAPEATAEFDGGAHDTSTCQQAGVVPRGTTAIRLALEVRAVGPEIALAVFSGARVATEGHIASGWGVATSATVPVRRVAQTLQHARVCITVGPTVEPFRVRGVPVDPNAAELHRLREIRLSIEYLQPGRRSWWSLASTVARHMGIGTAAGGPWVAFVVAAAIALVALLATRLAWQLAGDRDAGDSAEGKFADGPRSTRGVLGRVPRAAWVCALVACLNAACWSLITPPFQVPDEQTHFAYTQMLVENREVPESIESAYSPEEEAVLVDLHHQEVRGSPETPEISSPEQQQILSSALDAHLSRHPRAIGSAARYPPLYYLLQAIPYGLASPGTLLDQLALMRLFSALLAGVTTLFVFVFLREALPAARWTWTVGGLCAATAPLLGFMSGADNPDAMLFAISAATFYCLARAFRRGLTPRVAALLGALVAVGFLTKPNFVGLAPGAILGLFVLAARATRKDGPRAAAVSLALSLAIAASPIFAYVLVNLATNRAALGIVSYAFNSGTGPGSILAKASYIWQVYLPRLPGMSPHFPGLSTTRLWFDRYIGFYGWLDTTFPPSVETAALVPGALIGLLCVRGLALGRGALRRRAAELAVYASIAVGLAVLVGAGAYVNMSGEGFNFVEPRYLMPLLPLLALALALAARSAGRRWGPAVGAAVVMLFLAHDIFSQLLVIGRFYV
jgi:hypothetical protein